MLFLMILCMAFKLILMIATLMIGGSGLVGFLSAVDKVLTYGWMLGMFIYVMKHEKELNNKE